MFKFLDKVDGTKNDILAHSEIDNIIQRLTAVDRGNGTISITSRAIGADFTNEHMSYQVDDKKIDEDIDADVTGKGVNKFRFLSAVPAVDGDDGLIILAAGEHTVTAQIKDGVESAPLVSEKFQVAAVRKDLSAVTAEESDDAGIIQVTVGAVDLAAAGAEGVPGEAAGRLPGEESFTLGATGAANDLLVTLVDKDENDVAVSGVAGCSTAGDNSFVRSTIAENNSFRFQASGDALSADSSPYVLTITPRSPSGTAHTASAITLTVSIRE